MRPAWLAIGLLACQPSARHGVSTARPAIEPKRPARHESGLACACDVLDFENDGPPTGRCTMEVAPDGTATWKGETSSPPFSAKLSPVSRGSGRVAYVFEGEFDFACGEAWCGRQQHAVLEVGERDYRVTVARTADGPPSHVLWVRCAR